MIMNESCKNCIRSKQLKKSQKIKDESRRLSYMSAVDRIIEDNCRYVSTPELSEIIEGLTDRYPEVKENYTELKHKYNMLLLGLEDRLTEKINKSEDPMKECIKYVCAGNYIDFSAVSNVNEETLFSLFIKAENQQTDEKEYNYFISDLKKAESLIYLTDNCGEILLDKIFIKFIKKAFPELNITVMLRGKDTLNDATLADAEEIKLTEITRCVGNGSGCPGTVIKKLSSEARELLSGADVIISKGQGNFESLFKEGLDPYYMFLCKCDLFTKRFGIEKFSSVFRKESRIIIH